MYYLLDENKIPYMVDVVSDLDIFREFSVQDRKMLNTTLPCGGRVSTVFLGLDHNYGDTGPPILFESMLFVDGDEDQDRYCTWDEAVAGHWSMVVSNGGSKPTPPVRLDERLFEL